MAGRVVAVGFRRACVRALGLGCVLAAFSACSSFNPVEERRFKWLNATTYTELGMPTAYWHAYDDQHSRTSPCTNGVAGNHDPDECAHIDTPRIFDWDGGKCAPLGEKAKALTQPLEPSRKGSFSYCLQGSLDAILPCKDTQKGLYCTDSGTDDSNMWGAGFGLAFSADDDHKQAWDANRYGVTGVAFDLSILPDDRKVNLSVELPIMLSRTEPVPDDRPLMRDDGSVIGPQDDGQIHSYVCPSDSPVPAPKQPRPNAGQPRVLGDALTPYSDRCPHEEQGDLCVPSDLHPYGHPLWSDDRDDPTWGPSPVRPGHNEFRWGDVLVPKHSSEKDPPYDFESSRLLGILFHVVHAKNENLTYGFHFCISNLAFLQD